jgi:hypothetical protein
MNVKEMIGKTVASCAIINDVNVVAVAVEEGVEKEFVERAGEKLFADSIERFFVGVWERVGFGEVLEGTNIALVADVSDDGSVVVYVMPREGYENGGHKLAGQEGE